MKATTLILCITIVLGVSMLQDVSGGKKVTDKKLERWGARNVDVNKNEIDFKNVNLKKSRKVAKRGGNELGDLLNVIQYVITNSINNTEFRTFLIKRFLHNYVPEASKYLNEIKELKNKMDPKAAQEDDAKNKAMENQ